MYPIQKGCDISLSLKMQSFQPLQLEFIGTSILVAKKIKQEKHIKKLTYK